MTFLDEFDAVYHIVAYSALVVGLVVILICSFLEYKSAKSNFGRVIEEWQILQTENLVLREENKILKNGGGELPEFIKDLKAELEKEEK